MCSRAIEVERNGGSAQHFIEVVECNLCFAFFRGDRPSFMLKSSNEVLVPVGIGVRMEELCGCIPFLEP
jgi:hypothetical protein